MAEPATDTAPPAKVSMMDAIMHAKMAVDQMTNMTIDAVAGCERRPDGGWSVRIDVIESVARLGDNDLLACYEVQLDAGGELAEFKRSHRYHREDRDQA